MIVVSSYLWTAGTNYFREWDACDLQVKRVQLVSHENIQMSNTPTDIFPEDDIRGMISRGRV